MSAILTTRTSVFLMSALTLFAPTLHVSAQSLADVAKKEGDRRKTVEKPAKVYTNKDLTPVPAGSTPPPSSDSAAATPPDGSAKAADADAKPDAAKGASDKGTVKDQAYWSGRLKTLQDALTRNQNYADAMQTR